MGLATLNSRGQIGLDACPVSVEIHVTGGLPGFTLVGLPATNVRESRERVRAALANSGFSIPASRVTAYLGPADVPKEGGRFDLAIALGLLLASGQIKGQPENLEWLGELSLTGAVRPVRAALPAILAARAADRGLVLAAGNAAEAALVPGARVFLVEHLLQAVGHLSGAQPLEPLPTPPPWTPVANQDRLDDVRGQGAAKRALIIAAAGGHNLLLLGPPGGGKTMLAARLPELLPALELEEALEVAALASVAGLPKAPNDLRRRPFRAPHHSASMAAVVGGGNPPRPGEISLAHRGVLFLDELPEFQRSVLEALREPLEAGTIHIARASGHVRYPACFQLIAAMNPCPCGYLGDGTDRCTCGPAQVARYRGRISGPLLDRFDLHVEVARVAGETLLSGAAERPPGLGQLGAARSRQADRGQVNARLAGPLLSRWAPLCPDARALLVRAAERWLLSARAMVRIIRVARTIADLAESESLRLEHLSEALALRSFDRRL
jgi:magnesium chelatase family protein